MREVQAQLLAELERQGFQAKVVSNEHLGELQAEIEQLLVSGVLDQQLYRIMLSRLRFNYSADMPDAKSIVVIAMPEPITKLHITWRGVKHQVVLPPTYCPHWHQTVKDTMQAVLAAAGYRLAPVRLPLKLLAVRSGLSMYGRNNISYNHKFGSFYELLAFVSDMPCTSDSWQQASRMPACDNCEACVRGCPSKCIDAERSVIHAENCLTYFNEQPDQFPAWLESDWHNALIGCMRCQEVCPQNAGHAKTVEMNGVFTEEEIALILSGTELSSLPEQTRDMLVALHLADAHSEGYLSRNLDALLNR